MKESRLMESAEGDSSARVRDELLSRINAAHFLFTRVMPANDLPRNVTGITARSPGSQRDFKKPREHKKCNLPATDALKDSNSARRLASGI